MRKLLVFVGVLLAAHVALLFVRPSGAAGAPAGDALDVGIVFDLGGRGDKSFNDGAWIGAARAARELGARVRFVEPGEGSDREAGLRLLAAEGMDLVIGVGFIFTDDLTQLAGEYPGVAFAGVDYAVAIGKDGAPVPPPANLAALKFREEQGSFLVGALAALLSRDTKKVGFVGGMDSPLIHKFEAGYRAGVQRVCADCQVIAQYAGVTPEAFRNPGRGKELALSQYQQGVNIIYHASGSTGLGVFEAARAMNKFGIGQPVQRVEDRRFLTGRGRYAASISFPHQLHMRVVRSSRAHGNIISIDAVKALAAPGCVAALDFDIGLSAGMIPH